MKGGISMRLDAQSSRWLHRYIGSVKVSQQTASTTFILDLIIGVPFEEGVRQPLFGMLFDFTRMKHYQSEIVKKVDTSEKRGQAHTHNRITDCCRFRGSEKMRDPP